MSLILIACLMIALGAFVQGALGFGMAVVAAPVLYLLDPALVPGPIITVALVISALGTWRNRSQVNLSGIAMALVGRVPGGLLAVWLMGFGGQALSLLIAGSVLLAVPASLSKVRLRPTSTNLLIAGCFSGLFGTASSIGGPPMALLLQHEEAASVRANLSAYFTLSCVISLLMLAAGGFYGAEQLKYSLILLPAALIGFGLAQRVVGHLKQSQFRPLLLTLCSLSAIGVLVEPLFS